MEAAEALRELSRPWLDGEGKKRPIERAAKLAGLKYWRAFDIWYRKARRIEHHEAEAIARALDEKNTKDARNELSELRLSLERLEAKLSKMDQNFNRTTIDIPRPQARRARS